MSEIKANLAALSTQMAAMMEEVNKNRIDRYPIYPLEIILLIVLLYVQYGK
jgi:hypothetical protein